MNQQDLFTNTDYTDFDEHDVAEYYVHGRKPSAALRQILTTSHVRFFNEQIGPCQYVGDDQRYWPLGELPCECWGSDEAVNRWTDKGGLVGPTKPIKRLIARDTERRRLSVTNAAVSAGYGAAA